MNLTKRLLGSSTLNVVEHGVRFIAMFLVTPILIAGLGGEQYGVWLLLMTFFSYYSLLDLGMGIAGVRFMAKAMGDGGADVAMVLATCRRFFRRIALVSGLVTVVGIASISLLFSASGHALNAQLVIAICGAGISVRFMLMIFQVVLKSHLRYEVIALASIGRVIVQSVLVIVCVKAGYGLVAIAVVVSACDILQQIAQCRFARPLVKAIDSPAGLNAGDIGKRLVRYSMTSFGMRLSITLKDRIDPYLIGGLLGVAVVPLYSIGTRFLFMAGDVINALFGGQFLAAFSRMDGAGDQLSMRSKFLVSLRLCGSIATFICAVLVIQAGVFIDRWLGGGFRESYEVLLIIVFPYALYMMQYPSFSIISSMNKHSHVTRITAIGSVINIGLSVALGIYFGFRGIAWATAIDLGIVYLILFPRVVCLHTGVPGSSYLSALLRGVVPVAAGMYCSYLALRGWLEPSYSRIAFLGFIQTSIFCVIFWIFVLTNIERAWFLKVIRKKKSPVV
jgi:O-antigen/teichoic acid export membrane protein